jgi:hypothetical protein
MTDGREDEPGHDRDAGTTRNGQAGGLRATALGLAGRRIAEIYDEAPAGRRRHLAQLFFPAVRRSDALAPGPTDLEDAVW